MAANVSAKELVQLRVINENDTLLEQKRLRNGDMLMRNAIGESVILNNGIQIMLRPGYFSLNSPQEVTIERRRDGSTALTFSSGDQLCFNDEGIQSLQRGMLVFQFVRKADEQLELSNAFSPAASSACA